MSTLVRMDTNPSGQPADSYEQRSDLAIRSAAGDPTAEPRSTPSNQSPKHAKKPSVNGIGATQPDSQNANATKDPNPSHSSNSSVNTTKGKLPQAEEPSKPDKSKENGMSSNAQPASQATARLSPEIIAKRNMLFDRLKREQHAEILAKEKPEINVVLDLGLNQDGSPRPEIPVAAKAWESTPGSFLRHLDRDVSSDAVIAKVDGKQLWDLARPLEYACRVSYVPFSSSEGRNVFWHSSAHVLGEAAECQFNCLLSHGPPVEQGFFYDMAIADG